MKRLPVEDRLRPGISSKAARSLASKLRGKLIGEVRFDEGSRALYSTGASNYRQIPIGLVLPRDEEDVVQAVGACREAGAPVLTRVAAAGIIADHPTQ